MKISYDEDQYKLGMGDGIKFFENKRVYKSKVG